MPPVLPLFCLQVQLLKLKPKFGKPANITKAEHNYVGLNKPGISINLYNNNTFFVVLCKFITAFHAVAVVPTYMHAYIEHCE